MTENDYNNLFIQLDNLMKNAPCHNGILPCVGSQICEYGINGCYGEECAIEVVYSVASQKYYD
jgi:hypothetical protein